MQNLLLHFAYPKKAFVERVGLTSIDNALFVSKIDIQSITGQGLSEVFQKKKVLLQNHINANSRRSDTAGCNISSSTTHCLSIS